MFKILDIKILDISVVSDKLLTDKQQDLIDDVISRICHNWHLLENQNWN